MLRNYITIAFRNLTRNSFYSFINIGGLAAGITCTILIMLWVYDEISYDRFLTNHDRLNQIWIHTAFSDKTITYKSVALPLYQFLKTADARIKNTAVTDWGGQHLLSHGETKVNKVGYFVSPEFLEMFQFPLAKGEASQVIDDESSIVITESLSKALFGEKDPINQIIRIDHGLDFKVTGVLKAIPANSSFQFDYLLPWAVNAKEGWIKRSEQAWDNDSFQIFTELQPDADLKEVEYALQPMIKAKEPGTRKEIFLLPLTDWRLRSTFNNGKLVGGMNNYVKLFAAIAVFILIIACINFMNLATARSERRAREVGVRKAVGSRRSELIRQFLGEAFIISSLAFLLAIILVEVILPAYNILVNKHLSIDFSSPWVWLISILFISFTSLFAGSYPAFYLSSFNPTNVLKGKLHIAKSGVGPRKILVSLQFFFAIFLIGATFVVYQQILFVKDRDLGYDKENLIMTVMNQELGKNYKSLKEELINSGLVKSITGSSSAITDINGNNVLDWPGNQGEEILFSRVSTEYDYAKTMNIAVMEGRDFSSQFQSDSSAMLLNKAAVDAMGLENPIGAEIGMWGVKWKVVGVLEDALMSSPFKEIQPGFFLLRPDWIEVITLRLEESNDRPAAIKKIETIFKKYNPSYPFDYAFVDDAYERKFSSIEMIGTLANLFAFLAIFITCLGLYGLAAFTAEQRTKEIGIRKVMGASNLSVVKLLSRDFTYLVLIGFLVATPIAWWSFEKFLDSYDYRITLQWWILPVAGLITLLLVLIIVSSQAFRAASTNPSHSLRSE